MKIKKAEDIKSKPVDMEGAKDVRIRVLIGPVDEAPNFCMRQFDVAPGGHTPRHTHEWEHECYILAGRGTVLTPEGDREVSPGDCLYIAAGADHQFRNTGAEELKFLCLIPNTAR